MKNGNKEGKQHTSSVIEGLRRREILSLEFISFKFGAKELSSTTLVFAVGHSSCR